MTKEEFIILAKITKYQNKIFAMESKMRVKMIFEWFLMTKSKESVLCYLKGIIVVGTYEGKPRHPTTQPNRHPKKDGKSLMGM